MSTQTIKLTRVPPDKAEKGPDGRDLRTGRFLPGWDGGPGRPKRVDMFLLANERAKKNGRTLSDELWDIIEMLMLDAKMGNVAAARLVFEKLTLPEETVLKVQDELTDVERVERVRAILRAAESRRMLGNKPEDESTASRPAT